ncbi:MAG: nitrous oxide reductase accessory protein NosL [Desulfatiglandales bacterium]|jgi:nitrous oxide reductase accessory protein NosL|nr:nitrous oxide reductase accessory protein NosL [Desulfatiglandales bacterium]
MKKHPLLISMPLIMNLFSIQALGEEKPSSHSTQTHESHTKHSIQALVDEKSSIGPFGVMKKDKCPVCGMFVHKNPNWVAQIVFDDNTHVFFDGPRDMFKYYFDLRKYNPRKTTDGIVSLGVTDYYTVKPIDGKKAFYVVGSDVLGPMGRELVPHASEKAARYFMKDHGGHKVFRFGEINLGLIKTLR